MHLLWGALMAAIGLFMVIGGKLPGPPFLYRMLEARTRVMWKDRARAFLAVSGAVVMTGGLLWALGWIWKH